MNLEYVIDKINIKNLPEEIANYMQNNNSQKYTNLRSFYKELLKTVNDDLVDSYLNRILKYLSSDKESNIYILDDFYDGIYDDKLKLFCEQLCSEINKYKNNNQLYEKLNQLLNRMFFDYDDFVKVKNAHNDSDYSNFMFLLLKHCFENYKINVPNITAKRIYDVAMTLDDDSKKYHLIKLSSDLGNYDASLLYSSYIYNEDPDEAINLYLKFKSYPVAQWKIAKAIEENRLNPQTIILIKKTFKSFLIDNSLTKNIKIVNEKENKNLKLAFKIYDYCAANYNFNKAMKSIGQLLIDGNVIYKNKDESLRLGKEYFINAIKLGDIDSVLSMALYYHNHKNSKDYDEYLEHKYFQISAKYGDFTACNYYGEILLKEGKNDQAIQFFKKSAEGNNCIACKHLGKYYELKNDYPKAINYYKRAIQLNNYSAVIDLANLYYLLANVYKDNVYDGLAKSIVEDYYEYLSDKDKKQCSIFLDK